MKPPIDFYNPNNYNKKILNIAGKLIHEHGNLNRVPDLIVEEVGIKGCSLGIMLGTQYITYFSRQGDDCEAESMEIAVDRLGCKGQGSYKKKDGICNNVDCLVRQRLIEKCGQIDQRVNCILLANNKGFLMACGEGQDSTFVLVLRAIAHLILSSLDIDKNSKSASFFLPSEDIAQLWSEMLAGLSHDLRTPLACIKGYVTTLLREDVVWNAETQKDFLNIIVEETDYIENLINDLLDSSTFSWKGELELKKQIISLPQIVIKVLKDQSFSVKNHRITVLFSESFPFVEADPIRIEQVIRNLIDNAVKYSKENTQITIKGEIQPGEVVISVIDEGIGIDDEHLNRLFEKFFRVTSGINENKKGMGLGLPLARHILINHGGRIWAKSKLNQGTTFYFTLPYGVINSNEGNPRLAE